MEYDVCIHRAYLIRYAPEKQYRVVLHCNNWDGRPTLAQADSVLAELVPESQWKWFSKCREDNFMGYAPMDYDHGYKLKTISGPVARKILVHALKGGRWTGAYLRVDEIGAPGWEHMKQPTEEQLEQLMREAV